MRKPLIALGLAVSTGLGAIPVADALAAAPSHGSNPTKGSYNSSTPTTPANSTSNSTYSPQTTSHTSNSVSGAAIVATALKYLGYPYTATGNSPSTGFSCIGLVSFVYRSNGIALPGDLQDALNYAPQVPFSDLQPGDILYFQNTVWNGLSHAAIYLGGGKFVHAEFYGYGVRISSFNNDPKDGNYWIAHYLGANRPWGGAAVGAVITPVTPPSAGAGANTNPTASVTKTAANGPTGLVAVPSLNVRTTPSKSSAVQTVVQQGVSVTILGHSKGWYKVQLPDGTVGWVIAAGLGLNGSMSNPGTSPSTSVQPTIGDPVAPTTAVTLTKVPHKPAAVSKVNGLRVHSGPSTSAPVVSAVSRGQSMQVISRSNGWVKVRLSDGSIGWVSAAYAKVKSSAKHTAAPSQSAGASHAMAGASTATVAMNVRTGPSLHSSVATVLAPGTSYRVIGSTNGWYRVQLANGSTGWISRSVAGTSASTSAAGPTYRQVTASHTKRTTSSSSGHSVITVGANVHAAPGVKSRVIGGAAAGTHVTVLGHRGGWTLVRLPSGQTGYVLGSFVR